MNGDKSLTDAAGITIIPLRPALPGAQSDRGARRCRAAPWRFTLRPRVVDDVSASAAVCGLLSGRASLAPPGPSSRHTTAVAWRRLTVRAAALSRGVPAYAARRGVQLTRGTTAAAPYVPGWRIAKLPHSKAGAAMTVTDGERAMYCGESAACDNAKCAVGVANAGLRCKL